MLAVFSLASCSSRMKDSDLSQLQALVDAVVG